MNTNSLNQFLTQFLNLQNDVNIFWGIIKLFFMISFVLYALFAVIVVRQVFTMTKTFKTNAEGVLKIVSIIHLVFAIGVLLISYIVL